MLGDKEPLILAIETATRAGSVALARGSSITQDVCAFMISCDLAPFTNTVVVTAGASTNECANDINGNPKPYTSSGLAKVYAGRAAATESSRQPAS